MRTIQCWAYQITNENVLKSTPFINKKGSPGKFGMGPSS